MPLAFTQAFDLVPDSKRPAVAWADPQTARPAAAFVDENGESIRHGLPTGPRNGIFVIDLDRKNGVDGVASISTLGELPDTYTVRTPSGGLHLYYRWDPSRPVGNPVGVLPGVDVRGQGGYVVAGGDYRVVADRPVVDAPAWLYDLVTKGRDDGPPGEPATAIGPEHPEWSARWTMAETFLAAEPPCVSGHGGQKQIWKIALRLMRTYELPIGAALAALGPYNRRCEPPWSIADLERTLKRAAEQGQGPCGTFASGFLATPTAPAVAPEGEWRQRRNPAHQYTIDLATVCAGGYVESKQQSAKELAAGFAGPGAFEQWRGVWQYDIFRRRIVAVNPPLPLDAETVGLSSRDISAMKIWLSSVGAKASNEAIQDTINFAAKSAEFHPVRDYLDALPLMAPEAADAYFTGIAARLWGADERNDLESGHLRRLAIAAVRRVRVPGTKVDVMLVLSGPQGHLKSLFCDQLFGEFFLDQLPPISGGEGKAASIAIEGRWGVEIAELRAFSRASEAAKKEFLTRRIDKYRPVFGIAVQEWPRQCVFIGTTNDDEFLDDPTGATRYDVCDIVRPIDLEHFDRDEFWAAANALESAGELHYRDRAKVDVSENDQFRPESENGRFHAEDPWADVVLEYAQKQIEEKGYVRYQDCLSYALVIPLEKHDPENKRRVQSILRRKYGATKSRRFGAEIKKIYTSIKAWP